LIVAEQTTLIKDQAIGKPLNLRLLSFIAGGNGLPFGMSSDTDRTPRQRILELLIGTRLSSFQLAQLVGIPERHVEEHLSHIVKSVGRDQSRRFLLEPSTCRDCGFVFRERIRLTRPSRCPHCRSESITAPRYGIEPGPSPSGAR
jgi:transcriptional regulator